MLRDEDIDVQMPSMEGLTPEEAEDFYTPELMTAQIKLARITGNMITDLYNIPQPGKTNTFVQNVQRILTDLRSWHETLPEVLRLDFEAMPMYSSRSVASLHLHFGNTAMQTTRPILFHLFRQHFAPVSGTTTPREVLPITAALGESCVQAARTFSSILAQLWVDGSLAPFGYFDALSVFASTMILMMSAAMKEHDSNDDDAVETAWSLLRTMKEAGNIPAQGLTDQLTELRNDLDRLKERRKHKSNVTTAQRGDDTDGLGLLLAATGTFNHNRLPGLSGTSTPRAGAFGVSDAVGAFDDPFLQDFLQQPYRDWTAQNFGADPNEIPPGQLQFDWENANLFGSL
jgi:proline utilization trans-activator